MTAARAAAARATAARPAAAPAAAARPAAAPAAWWCEHAFITPGEVVPRVLVHADRGLITAIETDVAAPPNATRLNGLVLPGLANAHSHAFHRALRARTQSGSSDFWQWRQQMYGVAQRLDPDSYRALATAVYAEMALAGITCVGEFHYVHHRGDGRAYDDPNEMGNALAQAAATAGIRLTLLDSCYLRGGFDEPLAGAQRRFGDADAHAWAERALSRAQPPGVRLGAAVHSVRAVPADQVGVVAKAATAARLPLHMHVSEQLAENQACQAKYDRTPTELLDEAGALGTMSTAVHATHVNERDLSLLAASGAGVCLCPTTERDLADGIGPAPKFADRGIALSLGSDSHAVIDIFEEARAVELDERLASGQRGTFRAAQLLGAATANGHRALGWPDAGALAVGMRADLVAVDLASPRTAGCGPTAETAVFAAAAADVTDVVIDGEPVVRDRRHLRVDDVARALADAIAAVLP